MSKHINIVQNIGEKILKKYYEKGKVYSSSFWHFKSNKANNIHLACILNIVGQKCFAVSRVDVHTDGRLFFKAVFSFLWQPLKNGSLF